MKQTLEMVLHMAQIQRYGHRGCLLDWPLMQLQSRRLFLYLYSTLIFESPLFDVYAFN